MTGAKGKCAPMLFVATVCQDNGGVSPVQHAESGNIMLQSGCVVGDGMHLVGCPAASMF